VTQDGRIGASLTRLSAIAGLGQKWRELEQRASCSFFQSWTWVGTWLSCLPAPLDLYLLEVVDREQVIGLAVFGARNLVRRRFVRSRALLLHETGAKELDHMAIEYNSILAEYGREREVIQTAVKCIEAADILWDELMLSGVDALHFEEWQSAARGMGWHLVYREQSSCHYVDLEAVRKAGGDYLALLSSNTRQQIRRSIKAYGSPGALRVSVATTADAALEYLHGLQALHNARWQSRGKDGAFPSEFTRQFHERLVRDAAARGEVELLRVTAGEEIVGYLYNFVKNGHVYFYQSGFQYDEDAKLRPGLVCHYLAVMHDLKVGHRIYDFLAGPQRYKQSLGTAHVNMYWISFQKPRLVFAMERLLQHAKRTIRRYAGRSAS